MDEKFALTIVPYEGNHAVDYDFYIEAYTTPDNRVKIEKSSLIPVDQDSFVVPVDVSVFEPGLLFFDIYAKVPDRVFADGIRNEKLKVTTKYTVRP